jgi:transposase
VRPSALDPYKAFLAAALEQYPRLRATRLYVMLRERGFPGSAVQVRRYVRPIRPAPKTEAYLRLETLAGEQAQVDWGNFGAFSVSGTSRVLSCFVLVLSWSRAVYARFALDQTLESFLRGHVEAFAALGGVPRIILYDNLKSVVLERVGDHIRFHPRVLELAGHYHFAPQPCAPYRGNEKGKVERMIQYLRHSFFAARRFTSLADLNAHLAAWIAEIAHARAVPARGLARRLNHYSLRGLLVIDEIGYLSYDARAADLFFQVVSRRYERKSLVLTTNLPFSEWPTIFPNAATATALIDRVVHHAELLTIEGDSYRRRVAESARKTPKAPPP